MRRLYLIIGEQLLSIGDWATTYRYMDMNIYEGTGGDEAIRCK